MPQSISMRVQKHRDGLRASGLRPIQIWVPDTRKRGFKKECHRQSLLLKNDPQERDILKQISSVSDDTGWK
jgi:antidote-toxin recognition MazE-like antitoxin